MVTFLLLLQISAGSWQDSFDKATVFLQAGKLVEAQAELNTSLSLAEVMPPTHFAVALTKHSLGITAVRLGNLPAAREHFDAALMALRDVPNAAVYSMNVYGNLGQVQFQQGELQAAERSLRLAIEIARANSGPDEVPQAQLESILASVLIETGRVNEAFELLRRAQPVLRSHLSPTDISVVHSELRLSRALIGNGQYAAARELLQKVEADAVGTESHASVLTNLGDAYRTEGDFARATPILRKSLAEARRTNNLPLMLPSLLSLAFIDIAEGRPKLAELALRENLRIVESRFGRNYPARGTALIHLALAQAQQGRHAEAVDTLNEVVPVLKATVQESHPHWILERFIRSASEFALGHVESAAQLKRDGESRLSMCPAVEQVGLLQNYSILFRKFDPGGARRAERESRDLLKGLRQ